jgi:hypothetical protein
MTPRTNQPHNTSLAFCAPLLLSSDEPMSNHGTDDCGTFAACPTSYVRRMLRVGCRATPWHPPRENTPPRLGKPTISDFTRRVRRQPTSQDQPRSAVGNLPVLPPPRIEPTDAEPRQTSREAAALPSQGREPLERTTPIHLQAPEGGDRTIALPPCRVSSMLTQTNALSRTARNSATPCRMVALRRGCAVHSSRHLRRSTASSAPPSVPPFQGSPLQTRHTRGLRPWLFTIAPSGLRRSAHADSRTNPHLRPNLPVSSPPPIEPRATKPCKPSREAALATSRFHLHHASSRKMRSLVRPAAKRRHYLARGVSPWNAGLPSISKPPKGATEPPSPLRHRRRLRPMRLEVRDDAIEFHPP